MGNVQSSGLSAQYWQNQIRLKEESGLSRAAYCKKHNRSYHTFAYWEQKKPQRKAAQLLPVKIVQPQTSGVMEAQSNSSILCSVSLKNGYELKVYNPAVLTVILPLLS